ncbi:Transposon Ty3-I Gag-Pol polyprotein [Gossypium australe]|uniref:Transposon Ty3-I Gag-Pol polyprotein n=1 Tax=Gossypium australe TaxID=47621 RepID=A0A5B6VHQ9_9ROSI|nr:Transposon Ty3-I Gag-Pol polyprotein [Gossypium australe]
MAQPLTSLLKKDQQWHWIDSAQIAFQALKGFLCTAPILVLPNFGEVPFYVETNASGTSVGAVLQQRGKPVAFFSRSLGIKHQALSIYDKEMLAVLLAVKKWHSYLVGRPVVIKIDHQSLKFLSEKKAITPYQQKWVSKMLGYDYSIVYRRGSQNIVADVLSKRTQLPEGQLHQCLGIISLTWSELWDKILQATIEDFKLQQLSNDLSQKPQHHPKYTLDGRFIKEKMEGVHATRRRISSFLYWNRLSRDIKKWVQECTTCQQYKYDNVAYPGVL